MSTGTCRDGLRVCRGIATIAGLIFAVACSPTRSSPQTMPTLRDINAVLADHDDRLLAIPGVVGVYVGLLDDGHTTCLKVMLASPDPTALRALPRDLEGHPVVPEVTGELRPF